MPGESYRRWLGSFLLCYIFLVLISSLVYGCIHVPYFVCGYIHVPYCVCWCIHVPYCVCWCIHVPYFVDASMFHTLCVDASMFHTLCVDTSMFHTLCVQSVFCRVCAQRMYAIKKRSFNGAQIWIWELSWDCLLLKDFNWLNPPYFVYLHIPSSCFRPPASRSETFPMDPFSHRETDPTQKGTYLDEEFFLID